MICLAFHPAEALHACSAPVDRPSISLLLRLDVGNTLSLSHPTEFPWRAKLIWTTPGMIIRILLFRVGP